MDRTKNNKDYLLCEVKYQNFYILYNGVDEKSGMRIKDIFGVKKINENGFNYNDYETIIYEELVNTCYDLLKTQLKLIYDYLYINDDNIMYVDEKDINKIYMQLPKNIIKIIDKNAYGVGKKRLEDIINLEDKHGLMLYDIINYINAVREILEMFFETERYEEIRKNYLSCEEGKEEAELLEQVKLKKFG